MQQGCQEEALQIPQGRSFYLSLTCLFGALACYLSFLAYPLSHTRQTRPQLRSLRNLRSIPSCTALRRLAALGVALPPQQAATKVCVCGTGCSRVL